MKILALETSCDETAAAVVKTNKKNRVQILSNVIATSSELHAKTGGIIPEFAARETIKAIIPVTVEALLKSENIKTSDWTKDFNKARSILKDKIDAIAVTYGPGLIGSLLVGVETAKTLSFAFSKPVVPVHHLLAHLFANFSDQDNKIQYPFIGLIVSGGHTDLLLFESVSKFKWLGGTRDDAAGEAFDKIGRILNLPYPAGPEIERRASLVAGSKSEVSFKSPLFKSEDFDFSFSGLKAESSRFIAKAELTDELTNEICYALQKAIFDVLIIKTIRAVKLYKTKFILLGGGVSANVTLKKNLETELLESNLETQVLSPGLRLATDNAAMIGIYAALNYQPIPWSKLTAEPELYFD